VFLHNCATPIWSLKGPEGLPFSILDIFFRQKFSITLQRLQPSSILNRAVAVSLATFQLPPLQDTPPISTTDLFQVVGFLYGKIWPTYYKRLVFDMDKFWHLVWANLMSCIFSLFFLIPLYIFLIYNMSINKFCVGLHKKWTIFCFGSCFDWWRFRLKYWVKDFLQRT